MKKRSSSSIQPDHQLIIWIIILGSAAFVVIAGIFFITALQDKHRQANAIAAANAQPSAPVNLNAGNSSETNLLMSSPYFSSNPPALH